MFEGYSGATHVIFTVGDPIAQVTSPIGVTRALRAKGRDVIVVPAHVRKEDLRGFISHAKNMPNVDGLIVTVPHKQAALSECTEVTDRARMIGAVNVLKRNADGHWIGDIRDGAGYVNGLTRLGCTLEGSRVFLAGAGGAGSAIAFALIQAGVKSISLLEPDPSRREALATRVQNAGFNGLTIAAPDHFDCDLAINATPLGMRADDVLPFDVLRLSPKTFVGDVVDLPKPTALIQAARNLGCPTMTGNQMFEAVCEQVADFFLKQE